MNIKCNHLHSLLRKKMTHIEQKISNEDEIDFIGLLSLLRYNIIFICIFTASITLFSLINVMGNPNVYKAKINFSLPFEDSLISAQKMDDKLTKESIFRHFLDKVESRELQKETFIEGNFQQKFNTNNAQIENFDVFLRTSLNSLLVSSPNSSQRELNAQITMKELGLTYQNKTKYSISLQAENGEAALDYLNKLLLRANSQTIEYINYIFKLNNLKKVNNLKNLRTLAISQVKNDRISRIKRIKEDDIQKISFINNQIYRERFKAEQDRLSTLADLNDSLTLSESLGISENNFSNQKDSQSSITIFENNLPNWYLYGSNALIQEIKILNNRENNDLYIPKLASLRAQLHEVQNNELLKNLESRLDDLPYTELVNSIDNELYALQLKNKLKLENIWVANLIEKNNIPILIEQNKVRTLLLSFFGSLVLSFILILIFNIVRSIIRTLPIKKLS